MAPCVGASRWGLEMPDPCKNHLEEENVSGLETDLKSQRDLKLIPLVAVTVRQGIHSVFAQALSLESRFSKF